MIVSPPVTESMVDVLHHPRHHRPLPSPAALAHVGACPLVQIVVAGRSGSSLVHAYLDGHPQLLHVPHTFKFFDFVMAQRGLLDLTPGEIARSFADSPLSVFLFDTAKSVIIGGRLGEDGRVAIRVDKDAFCRAFESTMAEAALTYRTVFLGLVVAYGWCVGQDVMGARAVLQHLHHGDWLWPNLLLDRSNCPEPPALDGYQMLAPAKIIQSIRNPYDTFQSAAAFARQHGLDDAAAVELQEVLVHLFAQDWLRSRVIAGHGDECGRLIRIEDLRRDPLQTMRDCAAWIGIEDDTASLAHLTYFGFPWLGDIYTPRGSTIRQGGRSAVAWQDRAYLDVLLGPWPAKVGYQQSFGRGVRTALFVLSMLLPSPSVRAAAAGPGAYRHAIAIVAGRWAFARSFHQMIKSLRRTGVDV